jgi:DNA-binding response OmpR family regulator
VTLQTPASFSSTLLLLEDDCALATMLRDGLSARGFMVYVAASGEAAQHLADAVKPTLVMIDLTLPDRSGLLVCADLHQRLSVPIIIISGTRRKDDAALGFKLGACDFLAKPRLPG